MNDDVFSQSPFRCKLDWGVPGTVRAAARGDIIVLVDTLSFSTTVAYAVSRGVLIHPCRDSESAWQLARQIGGEVAVRRNEVPAHGRYSLSPLTFASAASGEKVVVYSPNGATCSKAATCASQILAGALVNASAIGAHLNRELSDQRRNITIIACGEREREPQRGDLRMAIEDYLAAGRIIAGLGCSKSPEAELCESAYRSAESRLADLIWDCASGRELRAAGFGEDVRFAAMIDSITAVPVLQDDAFRLMK